MGCSVSWGSIPSLGSFLSPMDGFWQSAEMTTNGESHEIKLGVESEVEVVFDERGIPHIFASSLRDAFYIQGYLHAADRLFQIDFTSRAATGRLSEIIGPGALEFDREMRRKGMPIMVENMAKFWKNNQEVNPFLDPYIAGINSYLQLLKKRHHPIEYKLMEYSPESWTAENTASILAYLNHQLTYKHRDVEATNTLNVLGIEEFNKLFPQRFEDEIPVVPFGWADNYPTSTSNRDTLLGSLLPGIFNPFSEEIIPTSGFQMPSELNGSNNWAIAPNKTVGGSTFLCNDPHLPLTLPSIWYECHIVTPEVNFYGFSIPGVPGFFLGMNDHYAVGTTNVGLDYLDYYKIHLFEDGKDQYIVDGEKKEFTWRKEIIKVKGQQSILDSFPQTEVGLMPFYDWKDHPLKQYAIKWRAIDPQGDILQALLQMISTTEFSSLMTVADQLTSPPQNIVYADLSGNIGLRITGDQPIRSNATDGQFLRDGSSLKNLLNKSIPQRELPFVYNPNGGFVASANQISTGTDYPYPHVGNYYSYRGTYLHNRLDSMGDINLNKMMELQNDNTSLLAIEMIHVLSKKIDDSDLTLKESEMFSTLLEWNCRFDENSTEAVFVKIWEKNLIELCWSDFKSDENLLTPSLKATLQLIEQEGNSTYFDKMHTQSVENAKDLVIESFKNSFLEFRNWKDESTNSNWSDFRNSSIGHLARIDGFGITSIKSGGTSSALNALKSNHGPSMRMIVEFKEGEGQIYTNLPGGRSGNPGSPYYDNLFPDWEKGNYHPCYTGNDPDPLMNNRTGQLFFRPSNPAN